MSRLQSDYTCKNNAVGLSNPKQTNSKNEGITNTQTRTPAPFAHHSSFLNQLGHIFSNNIKAPITGNDCGGQSSHRRSPRAHVSTGSVTRSKVQSRMSGASATITAPTDNKFKFHTNHSISVATTNGSRSAKPKATPRVQVEIVSSWTKKHG